MSASGLNSADFVVKEYYGLNPYGVSITPSEELSALLEQAKEMRALPFAERLEAVEKIAVGAMKNAFEGMYVGDASSKAKCEGLVFSPHSLQEALQEGLGCCRYQATLFLLLAQEARLGTRHYLQSSPMGGASTCFNDVYDEGGTVHHVSVYSKSLNDQKYNYAKDPKVFECPNVQLPRDQFLAYTIDAEGQRTLYARVGCHFDCEYLNAKNEKEKFEGWLVDLEKQAQDMAPEHKDYLQTQSNVEKCKAVIAKYQREMDRFAP